jgi:hypothetical protein
MPADSNAPPPLTDAELDALRAARTGGDRSRLEWSGAKVFSQSDEDGIIEEIFRRIGIRHRSFIEFGCETGHENNTRYLLEQGWRGLWIEGVPDYARAIRWEQRERLATGQLCFTEAFVNRRNVDDLFREGGFTGEIDLLSIDIDSNDYHVFEAITVVNPRVVALEHNHAYEPGIEYVMPYDESFRWDPKGGTAPYGASLTSMAALAARKGYVLVGCGVCSANGFYVRQDLVGDRFSGPFTPERLFNPLDYQVALRFPVARSPVVAAPAPQGLLARLRRWWR